ncbi:hypothetical protein FisN_22Lh189 [Fistulifera solaris]|uniref:Uncharacterized protein n=1 Tax=Fistulifera solaris TaxID=1519565 RepID=A0A1Z5JC15_FISSO|nr:hypothetical protein FisN_22Lh189 [Fistulifera solaris]|eukprot:GAX11496.1 hypothetical protein FisN_22Lh189 [Fistulifera solaris]
MKPFVAVLICLFTISDALVPSFRRNIVRHETQLGMFNFFDSLRRYIDPSWENNEEKADEKDDEAAGSHRLVSIPVQSLKPGALRLFLMFYLMGMQNTPDRQTWRANQPSSDEYIVDFYYHDQSGILSIKLGENEVTIDRLGTNPSNAYIMQESVIIEGVLNELHTCAFDESVAKEDRLLLLKEPHDAIEKARDALSFG